MKKGLAVVVACLLGTACLAGCGGEAGSASSAASSASAAVESSAPKAEEPKAEEPKAEEPKAEEPKAEEPKAEEPKTEEPAADASVTDTYTIGYNNFGMGVYAIDICMNEAQYAADLFGNDLQVVDDQFSVEKIYSNVQSLVASHIDGMVFMGIVPTCWEPVAEVLEENGVKWVIHDKEPAPELLDDFVNNYSTFCGGIIPSNYDSGYKIGKIAAEDGYKKAIVVGGAEGDSMHDDRIKGFTDAFEEGGGKVLGVTRCSDSSEAVTKTSDLITANMDADVAYGAGGDYVLGISNALENFPGMELGIYGANIEPELLKLLKSGRVSALDGGHYVEASITSCLLENALDGHPTLTDDGKPLVLDCLQTVVVTSENADLYDECWINDNALLPEQLKNLCWRYNPDVTWKDFEEFCKTYSFDGVVEAHGKS